MIDYIDIPVGGESPDRCAQDDPEACGLRPLGEILSRINSSTLKNARLLGSEPMVHPNFVETVAALRINGFQRIRVQTGGWGFRKPEQHWRVFQMGVRLFEVRFYSSLAREHDRLAGRGGAFAAARAALRRVRRAGARRIGGGPTFLEARIIVVPENVADLDRIIADVSRWHIHQLAVVPGRRLFPMREAARAVIRGIERALNARKWVYLDRWPACLFPGLELHFRETTRKTDGSTNHLANCQGCAYIKFCRGVPEGFELSVQGVSQPSPSGLNWAEFHRCVIRQGKDAC